MLENIRVVLMEETSHSGNIGAVARAMKNMGLSSLYLVSPRCSKDDEVAVSRSSGATELLESAIIVSTLAEAVSDWVPVVGTSTRLENRLASGNGEGLRQKNPKGKSQDLVALVFGREIAVSVMKSFSFVTLMSLYRRTLSFISEPGYGRSRSISYEIQEWLGLK